MQFNQAKEKFINEWGLLGVQWGVNKTMAKVHALLLISANPLSTENVMEELQISRGNANMNLRALLDWQLVYKKLKAGDRKEYFFADKDMWSIIRKVLSRRKKKEFDPMISVLQEVAAVEGVCHQSMEFCEVVDNMRQFSDQIDKSLEFFVKCEQKWLFTTIKKIVK